MKPISTGTSIVWDIAVHEAVIAGAEYIEKEHIFAAVFSLDKVVSLNPGDLRINTAQMDEIKKEYAVIDGLLMPLKTSMPMIRRNVRSASRPGSHDHGKGAVVHRSRECKEIFSRAGDLSTTPRITSKDILLAVLEKPGDVVRSAIEKSGVNFDMFKDAFSKDISMAEGLVPGKEGGRAEEKDVSATPILDTHGRNLTQEAEQGKLGPFIGRRKELLQIIQSLARSKKNNPMIVGEPGVGKTAVVEALAVRGVQGKDPQVLSGKRIIELNLGSLQGGTRYRGDYEERITGLMKEVKENPDIIVFIDEIHNLIGAGRVDRSLDAANLLKPALARGDFRCIGATTTGEFRRYVEKDPALERRFEMIMIGEPSRDEAVDILKGLCPKLKQHYRVEITDRAIKAAVDLSIRFDTDHRLPDKAIDLVDRAGAQARVPMLSMMPGGVIEGMEPASGGTVTDHSIAMVLSDKTGLPLEIISGQASGSVDSRVLELDPYLKKRIIGQDEAITRISERLKISYSGITKRNGPIGVFLLLGPTGVGKTETAKRIASFLFGNRDDIIRLDMSEFMEEHSVSKLIGSPPGYVGHEDEGQLTGKLRTRPYSIVLLDEVEKAHSRVFDLFLQVFDDGRITDSKGRTVDAKNSIFIMTSNIGIKESQKNNLGFVKKTDGNTIDSSAVMDALSGFFRREFLNRIDDIIVFNSLSEKAVIKIAAIMCDEILSVLMKKHGVQMDISEDAMSLIVSKGFSPDFGARELKRTIERLLQVPLSTLALNGEFQTKKNWRVTADVEVVSIKPV